MPRNNEHTVEHLKILLFNFNFFSLSERMLRFLFVCIYLSFNF